MEEKRVLPPSKVSSKTIGKRYVVLTITMSLNAAELAVRFGKGQKDKLVVREWFGFGTYFSCNSLGGLLFSCIFQTSMATKWQHIRSSHETNATVYDINVLKSFIGDPGLNPTAVQPQRLLSAGPNLWRKRRCKICSGTIQEIMLWMRPTMKIPCMVRTWTSY